MAYGMCISDCSYDVCASDWGCIWFIQKVRKQLYTFLQEIPIMSKWLIGCSALAFSIKVILQAGSTIPSLNNMAFGYRPIVIGYLHLVFLGIVTLFLLGYLFYKGYLKALKLTRSEEHTSELQSLMRNSYAVFCLKQKKTTNTQNKNT